MTGEQGLPYIGVEIGDWGGFAFSADSVGFHFLCFGKVCSSSAPQNMRHGHIARYEVLGLYLAMLSDCIL